MQERFQDLTNGVKEGIYIVQLTKENTYYHIIMFNHKINAEKIKNTIQLGIMSLLILH